MFLFRSFFWLGLLVMLLPPAADGSAPAPRTSFYATALAARALIADLSGMCERNPIACDIGRDAVSVVGRKVATGADIVVAGVAAGRSLAVSGEAPAAGAPASADTVSGAPVSAAVPKGSLTEEDLAPAWVAPAERR